MVWNFEHFHLTFFEAERQKYDQKVNSNCWKLFNFLCERSWWIWLWRVGCVCVCVSHEMSINKSIITWYIIKFIRQLHNILRITNIRSGTSVSDSWIIGGVMTDWIETIFVIVHVFELIITRYAQSFLFRILFTISHQNSPSDGGDGSTNTVSPCILHFLFLNSICLFQWQPIQFQLPVEQFNRQTGLVVNLPFVKCQYVKSVSQRLSRMWRRTKKKFNQP